MASTKEIRHHLKGATDRHRTMELGGQGSDAGGLCLSTHASRRSGGLDVGPRASRSLSTVHLRHYTRLRTAVVMRCSYMSLRRPSVAEHSPGWGGGASMRHNTHIHRADHDLQTSPCDPNSRLFSVRAGQQSSPYVLSILTRKGDRGRGTGEPWGCGSSRQYEGFFPRRAPSGWSWRNVGATPPHPTPRPRDARVHAADEFPERALFVSPTLPRQLFHRSFQAGEDVEPGPLGTGAGDYSSSDRMTWKRVTL